MEEEKETNKRYRTYQIHIKKGHKLYAYFNELTLTSNNLYNTTNFYIRQVYTAFKQGNVLQPLQKEVMDSITLNIGKMNGKQHKAYLKRLNNEMKKPENERKEVKENLFTLPTKESSFIGFNFLDCLFKTIKQTDYNSLPGQINQQVIRNVVQNWKSFFTSLKDYKAHPEKYKGRPSIPAYLPKGGRKEIVLSNQICKIKDGKYLQFPKTNIQLNIGKLAQLEGTYQQVRVVPKYNEFTVEVIFLMKETEVIVAKKESCMGIDLGLNNLATVVFNTGISPIIFKGGKVKSINQWYNKLRSHYYAVLRNGKSPKEGKYDSKRLMNLDKKRYRKIKDFFHKVSYNIVKVARENGIDTIVIGKNSDWKQEINTGKRNNQHFVQIPHTLLIELITYKANDIGIAVMTTEESYTSKASFLDEDDIPTYQVGNNETYTFSGKRIKRGLYRSKHNRLINADVNGAANIVRKVIPNAFANGIAAMCSSPLVVNVH
ncbi:RNA-guided endonuclease InsQ/TnpB family protein [Paucisalibacillus globulus]|uniref:RNA-guided endonuclease InsQ/TnpB family protein n=1 Tax=Paucisalibacillus globulus TaxID=351095 RepID=UPI0004174C5E|nr:RNA-guided endonuclease TnpB family protein [Paucisalibacillus globulus]